MSRIFMKYAVLGFVLLAATGASAAERLKQVTAVYLDDKGGALAAPEGIACDTKGGIVVADTGNGRLLKYSFKDAGISGGSEVKVPQLTVPTRLQLDSKGDIYALDGKLRRIAHLKGDGSFVGYLDLHGVPAPDPQIRSFRVGANDQVYLLDILGRRVLELDPSGNFQRQLPFPAEAGFCSDLALTRGGDLLLLDSLTSVVYAASKGGAEFKPLSKDLKEYVSFATYLTTDSRGTIFVMDQNGSSLVTLGPDGTYTGRLLALGWKEGQLYYPAQICVSDGGLLGIADRNNSRAQFFELIK
ncbi:hypothetical protein E4633_14575 [Geomonas terrae]|uniref:6-bladed beta-propeller n=1 Tax=Geomonas terrae TaxID=2562681 RepID=A0A4S1CE72_9BACT|nr:hypothetical protein [Geomonas terrae]TGU71533.1 hypothetical protein E4633_14575 [Geomonas terrae]